MKKLLITLTLVFLAVVLGACGKKETGGNFDVPNGKYFAAADTFSNGYRYYVVVDVKDKEITNVEWNGYNIDGGAGKCLGDDKLTCADPDNNTYGMSGDLGTWTEQSEAAAQWIVDNQQIVTPLDETGHADAVSTASIHTGELFELVFDALANGPVPAGDYTEDGYYYYESTKDSKTTEFAKAYVTTDDNGDQVVNYIKDDSDNVEIQTDTYSTYTMGTFVIVNGTIVLGDFNATQNIYEYVTEDGRFVKYTDADGNKYNTILMVPKKDSDGNVVDGEYVAKSSYVTKDDAYKWYGMSQAGKTEWTDQMKAAEEKLVADQSLDITISDGAGTIDGLTSVSISHTVASLQEILDQLDEDAK
jgi:uncharacterized protein YuzB (UPF0349 family)